MKREKRLMEKANLKMIFNFVIIIALIVVVVILIIMNNRSNLNDDYFKTDNSKIVVTMNDEVSSYEESEYEPPITHMVYYLAGDNVSDVKLYFQYDNEDDAKNAYDNITLDDKEWANSKTRDGKYIVIDLKSDQYNGMTAEQVRMFAN